MRALGPTQRFENTFWILLPPWVMAKLRSTFKFSVKVVGQTHKWLKFLYELTDGHGLLLFQEEGGGEEPKCVLESLSGT